MSPASRMRALGAVVSSTHLLLATLGWALLGVPPWFFGGCAVVTLGVALLAAPLMSRPPEDGEDGDGGSPLPEDPEPPWWPDFERDLRAYEQSRRGTAVR